MSKKWETITFDQIRKGDRVRSTKNSGDMMLTYDGIADYTTRALWFTECGWFIAGRVGYTIQRRVVKAPKPEPLPTKLGSVIIVHECNGLELNAYRQYLLDATGTWRSGFHISTQNAAATYFTKWEHAVVVPSSTVKD